MRIYVTLLFLFLFTYSALAVVPDNDDVKTAKNVPVITNYCSGDAAFSNVEATASGYQKASLWNTPGKDVWFSFTATKTDLVVSVTGKINTTTTNTLILPTIAVYTFENNILSEMVGTMSSSNNLTTAYKGGLTIGVTYYIRISAENDNTGTFKLCVNNYNPATKPGQDCSSASVLCNKETFTELSVSGAGINNREAAGSCLGVESNSAWYKWTAANSGTLTFVITPTSIRDDIDWALYDLGTSGDCSGITTANLMRCAAGSGVTCSPIYYKTGLNLTSTDISEAAGCPTGQDGFTKYIDMIEGHVYALIVDNFSSGNNGFTLEFGGTGEFVGPKAAIQAQVLNACLDNPNYTFSSNSTNYSNLKWSFGDGANMASSTSAGPHTITYSTPGNKTVILEAIGSRGCVVIDSYVFSLAKKADAPVVRVNKPDFCLKDTLVLETDSLEGAVYVWTGPNNFKAGTAKVSIPVNSLNLSGTYSLALKYGDCATEQSTVVIPAIVKNPVAAFTADPEVPAKYSLPIPIQFFNQSQNAVRYVWDFGDGETSAETNPVHEYTRKGTYDVTLTAFTENDCEHSITVNNLVITDNITVLVPSSFSPNGDGTNDLFKVSLINIKRYRINVFNRYGEKVFYSEDISNSWDGTYKGQSVPVGVYFYQILASDVFKKEISYSGSITLIR